ncbi:hypothetical protein COEREDRAFT_82969 [Coemansia reversa NRRL 1564]|uniref:SH3 domain-containing protein n=1 Tax=Coemansia reversa (strain ATCC 12441 / NRRL 1564) TaxID=763665 RepID=A0A2G5B560_COERN|nr:hypothetical protein COEREDRAFT_82969 [Coemansia reversa NRRL 1564]|eukprot:PIA14145.1 hypothetical protein COEREDRAFT_82969 [Coemansia reversa NRRL 1564]
MKSAFTATALILAGYVAAYDIIRASSLNCREKPTTKSEAVKIYEMGDDVDIKCQVHGEKVMGGDVWDKTQDGCYVLDYYLYTGFSYMFKGECSKSDDESADKSSDSSNTKDKDEDDSESGKDVDDEDSKSVKDDKPSDDDDETSKSVKDDKPSDDDDETSKSNKNVDDDDLNDGLDSKTDTDKQTDAKIETDPETSEDKDNEDDNTGGASSLSWGSTTTVAAGITAGLLASIF